MLILELRYLILKTFKLAELGAIYIQCIFVPFLDIMQGSCVRLVSATVFRCLSNLSDANLIYSLQRDHSKPMKYPTHTPYSPIIHRQKYSPPVKSMTCLSISSRRRYQTNQHFPLAFRRTFGIEYLIAQPRIHACTVREPEYPEHN